jgi:hypothetical protein
VPRHWDYGRPRDDATTVQEDVMEIDNEKVDEITLALLYLTTFKDKSGLRAWKSHSWDVLNRLHKAATFTTR